MQLAPPANTPPAKATEEEPGAAVTTLPTPQSPTKPLGVDTTRPAGKLSVNVMLFAAGPSRLMVNASEVELPTETLGAPNALLKVKTTPACAPVSYTHLTLPTIYSV